MVILRTWIVMAALLQSGSTPIRIGDFAKKLTSQEIMELDRIAAAGGAKGAPWLLEGSIGQISNCPPICPPACPPNKEELVDLEGAAISLSHE